MSATTKLTHCIKEETDKKDEDIQVESTQESKNDKGQVNDNNKGKRIEGRNQKIGRLGEEMACHYLYENGITVIERNWKCKSGEADIIADEDETLVFIEVKTRSAGHLGLPEYAVTKQKRDKYEKIATSYLMKHQRSSGRVRFDVIAIQMTGEKQCLLRHHRDAFATDV